MKILILGNNEEALSRALPGHQLEFNREKFTISYLEELSPEFLISFGYSHILSNELISYFEGRAVNLHISLLPWNRGADPNFWSWFDSTPKGVSIHTLDEGIDSGNLLLQREVIFDVEQTLQSSYLQLTDKILDLFTQNIDAILYGDIEPISQIGKGTFHLGNEIEPFKKLLPHGWQTSCKEVEEMGRSFRGESNTTTHLFSDS